MIEINVQNKIPKYLYFYVANTKLFMFSKFKIVVAQEL